MVSHKLVDVALAVGTVFVVAHKILVVVLTGTFGSVSPLGILAVCMVVVIAHKLAVVFFLAGTVVLVPGTMVKQLLPYMLASYSF